MAQLIITSSRDETQRFTLLELQGNLDVFSYLALKADLEAKAAEFQGGRILIDLRQVAFIASSGWAVLMAFCKSYKRQQGIVAIFGMVPEVSGVYETMNLATLLPAYPDLAAARASLGPAPGAGGAG
jgi:anti-anti-sigma factor